MVSALLACVGSYTAHKKCIRNINNKIKQEIHCYLLRNALSMKIIIDMYNMRTAKLSTVEFPAGADYIWNKDNSLSYFKHCLIMNSVSYYNVYDNKI